MATRPPHEAPSSTAVSSSRRSILTYQPQFGRVARRAWIVTVIDWLLTLSPNPEDQGEKERQDDALGQGRREGAGQQGTEQAAADRGDQPGEAIAKHPRRRGPAHLGHAKADGLEDLVHPLAFGDVEDVAGERADIDDAGHVLLLIHDRDGEQPVPDEELAGVEDAGRVRDGDDAAHHDIAKRSLQFGGEQAARGDHAHQTVLVIDDVEVDDPFAEVAAADGT